MKTASTANSGANPKTRGNHTTIQCGMSLPSRNIRARAHAQLVTARAASEEKNQNCCKYVDGWSVEPLSAMRKSCPCGERIKPSASASPSRQKMHNHSAAKNGRQTFEPQAKAKTSAVKTNPTIS